MKNNIYNENWQEGIQRMDKQELLNVLVNSGEYNPEYIELVCEKLVKCYHYTQDELKSTIKDSTIKYYANTIIKETDKPLSVLEKVLVIFGILIVPWFTLCFVLFMRAKKVTNSLGENRYLYNESGRKWLLYSVISCCLLWGFIFSLIFFCIKTSENVIL